MNIKQMLKHIEEGDHITPEHLQDLVQYVKELKEENAQLKADIETFKKLALAEDSEDSVEAFIKGQDVEKDSEEEA